MKENSLNKLIPNFDRERAGYEIIAFAWHQGWNDSVPKWGKDDKAQEYEENMADFIGSLYAFLFNYTVYMF